MSNGLARTVPTDGLDRAPPNCLGVVWGSQEPDEDGQRRVLAFVAPNPFQAVAGRRPAAITLAESLDKMQSELEAISAKGPQSQQQMRWYQEEGYARTLGENTLVCLGTGLGKTLIAARAIDHYTSTQPTKKVCLC